MHQYSGFFNAPRLYSPPISSNRITDMYQLNFDLNDFLTRFWHKEPVVIKNGFVDFEDPISPDEVAGLAMEEEIDSRFVTNLDGNCRRSMAHSKASMTFLTPIRN